MKTIKDVFIAYKLGLNNLYELNELEAITLLVISEICYLSKAKIKAFPEFELSDNESEKLGDSLSQLKTGKPVQYILGKTEFYGLPFHVNPAVLIPRPETEELVEWVINTVNGLRSAVGGSHILDIGTGSGCIAISLKKNLSQFNVSAIDISAKALKIAKENAKLNEADVKFIEADVLQLNSEPDSYRVEIPKSEIIISNPPYVTQHDKARMHHNVTDFEPHTALFVPENNPLLFYDAIADFSLKNLKPDGLLFFEINESLGKQTVELLVAKGFENIELRKDMSGRDRMIRASLGN